MGRFRLNKAQKIGLFVIVVLIATYTLINFLRGKDIFNNSSDYYTSLANAEGINVSSPVYFKGLKIGAVKSIKYNAQRDCFIACLNIKSEYTITSNAVVEIYSSDILGGKAIRINPGDSNLKAGSNDTLPSTVVPDMLSMISEEIGPMSSQFSSLLSNMNKTFENINVILDSSARKNIEASLSNLNRSLANIATLSSSLNNLAPQIASVIANLDTLSTALGKESGNFASIVENLDKVSSDLANAELEATVKSIRGLAESLQNPEGSIGKLLTTPSIHDSVDTLVKNLNTFVEKMTEHPKKFIKISVF